jgi:transketolase
MKLLTSADYGGRYIHWGIREHAMAAGMNGLSLHGGVIPYGGSFLAFTDYCRPSIRLAALMGIRVILVMTHDSIGLGEDGPTHQPIEQLAALRAIPNLLVLRPCDAVETAEVWEVALNERHRPSVMALSRQKLKPCRLANSADNLSARGAYVIAGEEDGGSAVIFASGSEVEIALGARSLLEADGIRTRVVSVPSMELFARQSAEYRAKVLGRERVRGAIEAGVRMGWDPFIGTDGEFIGMSGFGASGPYDKVYAHFGITAAAAAAKLKARFEARKDGQVRDD